MAKLIIYAIIDCKKNKLLSVFRASVLLLTMISFVTLSNKSSDHPAILTILWLNLSSVAWQAHEKLATIC